MNQAKTPKVVVVDPISAIGLEMLAQDCQVVNAVGLPREQVLEMLADAEGLVLRSSFKADREVLDAAPRLRGIGRAGVGLDNIDMEEAQARGIKVVNTPAANSISAAEHTIAIMLAMARNIPQADAQIRSGVWDRVGLRGVELYGKVLGVVGMGRIGFLVAERARAFGMSVLAYDPYIPAQRVQEAGGELVDLDRLLAEADFITIHIPLTPETNKLIGAEAFTKTKQGVRVINASRGGVLDEEALAEALVSGQVGGAALDVFASEPMTEGPLLDVSNVVVTPHIAASTVEAQDRVGEEVAQLLLEVLTG